MSSSNKLNYITIKHYDEGCPDTCDLVKFSVNISINISIIYYWTFYKVGIIYNLDSYSNSFFVYSGKSTIIWNFKILISNQKSSILKS